MNFTKPQLILIGAVGFVVVLVGFVFAGVLPGLKSNQPEGVKAELEMWGVFDNQSAYEAALGDFKTAYPGVSINYRGFNSEKNYKNELLDALAAGKGPDIFAIKNSELAREINKISPVPQTKFSLLRLRGLFPQIVELDFVSKNSVYALPLSIDTLAMIYNRDFFNQAGAAVVPETWEDLKPLINQLTKFDENKNIAVAGAAIGGSEINIDKATHLLYALMLQTGTKMVGSDFKSASFNSSEGNEAFGFYVRFADPKSPDYTWNETLPNSLDGISQNKIAMIFNYAASIPQIKSRNPFINLGVAPFPQPASISKNITYPNYWGYAVSLQSKNKNLAWDFIISLTAKTGNAEGYLQKTKRPPALLQLIDKYKNDPDLNVFVKQALVARSWPQIDSLKTDEIFSKAIELASSGIVKPAEVLSQTKEQITQLMGRKSF